MLHTKSFKTFIGTNNDNIIKPKTTRQSLHHHRTTNLFPLPCFNNYINYHYYPQKGDIPCTENIHLHKFHDTSKDSIIFVYTHPI